MIDSGIIFDTMAARSIPRARARVAHPAPARSLDPLDFELLRRLQDDARTPVAELARRVGLSAPGVQKRLRRLEQSGVVARYVARVSREAVGLDLMCFVQVTLAHHQPATVAGFRKAVGSLPDVLECHHLTGDYDYLLKVVVPNHKALEAFLVDKLTPVPGVGRIRTSIVLHEIKDGAALPLEPRPRPKARRTA